MTDSPSHTSEALTPESKSALKVIFLTLFIDLVGFSIIFPLFPSMLKYYTEREGGEGVIGFVVDGLTRFTDFAGAPGDIGIIVLFGGLLSSIYSLLQFVFAPVIGSLSDTYGRRPILLVCIAGIAISYIMWFFAGSFVVLLLARFLGGVMSGNISTASAVVADVTSERNRSKGMALIGIAFGLGFILGPAIGGISASIDLVELFPESEAWGVNPFSAPAAIAFVLAAINFFFVVTTFKETLPSGPVERTVERTANPLRLFSTEAYPGVTQTNIANFLFLAAFSGMEFSLTFLGLDRFGYGPMENAYMLLFVGVVLVLVQGGYVRRRSVVIGPKRMSVHGFLAVIPGLALVAFAPSPLVLYGGLFLMAVGSAQVIPCLTALASLYAPAREQGRILGVFRSMGALARGVGPLFACLLYWRLGATAAYLIAAAVIFAPLALALNLPDPHTRAKQAEGV